jgi:predicted TIM-barrel fold metal-dependent hydrolase
MLPSVDFCGLNVTRLIVGANPFGGYSHQTPERDREMRAYHTVARIHETWARAEAAGINTMITNNETPHVLEAVRTYLEAGGRLQWIAQVNLREKRDMTRAIEEVVRIGCRALYFHGALVDDAYRRRDQETLLAWCEAARAHGVPAGVAGHAPEAHLWVNSLDIADFHAVCFFNCGSLHTGGGDKFRLADIYRATEVIRQIRKPCIGYKIMGAGRIDARMAFEYAFGAIKANDVVNVGMHRGDNDTMVEENAALVAEILGH